jgi:hypothetical protein
VEEEGTPADLFGQPRSKKFASVHGSDVLRLTSRPGKPEQGKIGAVNTKRKTKFNKETDMKLKVLSLIALLAGAASGAAAEGQLKIGTEGAYPPWSMATPMALSPALTPT